MGHKGDIERKYTLNKHRLPQQLAEDMKRQYEQGATFLDPEQLTAKQVEEKVELVRADLRARVEEEHKSELAQLKAQVSELSGLKEKVDILMALTRIYPAKLEELAKPSPDAETGLTELKELGLLAES